MKRKIRILVVDDHPLMRVGLTTAINAENDMEVIAEASTGEQAITLYRRHTPDLVLMDLQLPDMRGNEVSAQLCKEFPAAKVVMLSVSESATAISRCTRAGARSYLSKRLPLEELLGAIRIVDSGRSYLPPEIENQLLARERSLAAPR